MLRPRTAAATVKTVAALFTQRRVIVAYVFVIE